MLALLLLLLPSITLAGISCSGEGSFCWAGPLYGCCEGGNCWVKSVFHQCVKNHVCNWPWWKKPGACWGRSIGMTETNQGYYFFAAGAVALLLLAVVVTWVGKKLSQRKAAVEAKTGGGLEASLLLA